MEELKKQASNIDEQGNVLYLDQERLDRKEVGFPPYKNRPNGLGIFNWLLEHVLYMDDKRWPIVLKLYHVFVKFSAWMKQGGWKADLYKRIIMLAPNMKRHTGTIVLPLDVDVTDKAEKVVVPLDLIKESLKKVDYIAGMDGCLCRQANSCDDFPQELGCLFLGEAAKTVVKHKLGRQFTYEEACARVDEAARVGLMGQAVWIEVEQMIWGVRNDEMDHFMEICFCCPCCCIAMRLARNATEKERHRFHPSGWTAVPDRTKCVGCGKCIQGHNGCPVEAISFGPDGKVQIDQEACVGCGICKARCNLDVIKIKQTMPMRADLQEYFLKDYNLDIKLGESEPEEVRIIEVKQSVFADNDADANKLRQQLKEEKTFLLNVMSSPGAGKTTLLKQITGRLKERIRVGVMEADIDSDVDAKAMQACGVDAIQIHTGGMCHLDADMTRQGLTELGSADYDLVILENVGNLVCPAEFDTGAVKNMTILSVPEGHDKPLKYPLMYETCQLLVINKVDVMPYFDFDARKVVEYAKMRNPEIEILFVSAKTGEGVDAVADWIMNNTMAWNK